MFSFRKLLGCILAPVGAFTIIGSGFSLWYFVDGDKPVAKESVDIGVNALDAVSKGNIDIIQSPHLVVLSQGSSNSENLFDGMVFYSNSNIDIEGKTEVAVVPDDTFTFRYINATKFIPSDENNDLSNYGLKLNIAIYFELSDSVEDTSDYSIDRFLTIKSDVTNDKYCHQIDTYFPSTENNISKESKYFFLTDDPFYTNAIGFTKTTGTVDDGSGNSYIEYTVSLNQFFRYTSVDVKPDTLEKYKSLTEAISKGVRDINIYVAAFYSDSVAIGG